MFTWPPSLQLIAGIKKAGLMGGTHRFLAFQRPLRGHTHRFLATRSTVTCRLHGYYRVPGLREGSELGRTGVRHGITCVWTGYRRVLAGRKVRTAIRQLLTQCQTAAEPTDSTPNVVTCHVTVISWLGRERHAPFLIRNRKKSIRDFLTRRFLNAREQL